MIDLNKLLEFTKSEGLSFEIRYFNGSGYFDISIIGDSLEKNYFEKKVNNINSFIENYKKKLEVFS